MRSEDIKFVIIQAGGKGIRMGRYAENKPKCLVPVKGIPMIMNTIEKYKDKEIIIISLSLYFSMVFIIIGTPFTGTKHFGLFSA